jgi:hypothetical protein
VAENLLHVPNYRFAHLHAKRLHQLVVVVVGLDHVSGHDVTVAGENENVVRR